MQLYYQTDVSFMTAFLLMLISVIAYFRLNGKDTVSRVYLTTAWIIVFILVIEAYTIMIDGQTDSTSVFLAISLNTLLFAIGPVLTLSWYYLIRSMFAPNLKKQQWRNALILAPLVINIILVITNPWTKLIFSVENGQYIRNDLYPIVTAATYLYLLLAMIIVIRNRKTVNKQDKILLFVSFLLPMIGGLIQALYYGILTIWPSVAFALILMYLFLQQRVIHLDYLTGAWTRETFFLHINRLIKSDSHDPVSALYFDLDNLKAINDTYGHIAGDKALKKIVEVVRNQLSSHDIIARLGGDEFIALVRPNQDLNSLVKNIHDEIDRVNENNEFQFKLGISIGFGLFKDHYDQFDKFMNHIDQNMYIEKHKKLKISK